MNAASILSQRAEHLAKEVEVGANQQRENSVITFTVNEERFAFPLAKVSEVIKSYKLTLVPGADPRLRGIIAVKNEVYCIFDLAQALDLPLLQNRQANQQSEVVLILRHPSLRIGFCVDAVEGIDHVLLGNDQKQDNISKPTDFVKLAKTPPLLLIDKF